MRSEVNSADVEAVIARSTVLRAVYVGPVLVALFWVTRGGAGAVGAVIGLAVVAGNFLLSGAMLSAAARRSLNLYHAAALFGFLLRLGLITATLLVVSWAADVDRLALGITAIASYLALLVWESLAITRGVGRHPNWTS